MGKLKETKQGHHSTKSNPLVENSSRIDAKRAEIAQHRRDRRKLELFKLLADHLRGIVYVIAELYLGYKPDFKR